MLNIEGDIIIPKNEVETYLKSLNWENSNLKLLHV